MPIQCNANGHGRQPRPSVNDNNDIIRIKTGPGHVKTSTILYIAGKLLIHTILSVSRRQVLVVGVDMTVTRSPCKRQFSFASFVHGFKPSALVLCS